MFSDSETSNSVSDDKPVVTDIPDAQTIYNYIESMTIPIKMPKIIVQEHLCRKTGPLMWGIEKGRI